MAGEPVVVTPWIDCAARGCPSKTLRNIDPTGDGRPEPSDAGWGEVELTNLNSKSRTILFGCSNRCLSAIANGHIKGARPMSDKKIDLG